MPESKPSIGLSWAPKIPALIAVPSCDAREKHLPSPPQNPVWKPEAQLVDGLFVPPTDPRWLNKLARKGMKDTTGSSWFDIPAPTITREVKNDLEILKLRSVIDPRRHYKKGGSKSKVLPKYFQMGTIIESNTDYYSSRLTKKERKAAIADELLSDPSVNAYRKRKVREIDEAKRPGGLEKWKIKGSQTRRRSKPKKAIP